MEKTEIKLRYIFIKKEELIFMKKIILAAVAFATLCTSAIFAETYTWNFQNGVKNVSKSTVKADMNIPSEPAGLTLNIAKGGYFNLIDPAKSCGDSQKAAGATKGVIQPAGPNTKDAAGKVGMVTSKIKGPFTVKMSVSGTGSSAKLGRHAFIKINGKEFVDPNFTDKVPGSGESPSAFCLTANYDGTDVAEVQFGGTDLIAIWNIEVETK